MKRIGTAALTLALAGAMTLPALAAEPQQAAYATAIFVNGQALDTSAIPAVEGLPMRLVVEADHGSAAWFEEEGTGSFYLEGNSITVTFAIGSALAGVAAIFYGAAYTYIRPTTGAMPGIKAFTAAVFGGIGSIPGAMLGGVLLGVIEQLSKTYISTLWADAIVFGVLVAVLVVKPTGLLGKRISEKV